MQRSRRTAAVAVLATLALGGATAAVAQPAVAAPAATAAQASYNGVCGTGYKVVNSADIGKQGTVYLTYNSANGRNCAVTIRKTSGSPVYMFASLAVPGVGGPQIDADLYRSYAGPVYVYGRGLCVDWGGGISNQQTWTYGSNCGALSATRVTKKGDVTLRSTVAEPGASRVAAGAR